MRVVVEADGGSRGNPGPAGFGAVVFAAATGEVLAERYEAIGVETNNVAEYRGLIAGLDAALEIGATEVEVRMDSKLVIEQMSGRWQVKHPSMRPLASRARTLLSRFAHVSLQWIPREQNKHADRLANRAMDEAAGRRGSSTLAGPPVAADPVQDSAVQAWDASGQLPAANESVRPEAPANSWVPAGAPTRLILLRHGSTEHSPSRRLSGRNELPLSELGQQQATELAARVATRYRDIAAVVTSPLLRARQTAAAVAEPLGLSPYPIEGFAEMDFGEWEGLTGDEARRRWPVQHAAWLASTDVAPPGGESMAALTRRVRRARDEVLARHPGQVVAVVSHVTPIKALLRLALDAPSTAMFRIMLDVASTSIIDYQPDGTSVVRLVNAT
jgi:probable phosphoglycerate mutase